jgi:hypothetical protein
MLPDREEVCMTNQPLSFSSQIREVALNCRSFSINGMLPAGFMQGIEAETYRMQAEKCSFVYVSTSTPKRR